MLCRTLKCLEEKVDEIKLAVFEFYILRERYITFCSNVYKEEVKQILQ